MFLVTRFCISYYVWVVSILLWYVLDGVYFLFVVLLAHLVCWVVCVSLLEMQHVCVVLGDWMCCVCVWWWLWVFCRFWRCVCCLLLLLWCLGSWWICCFRVLMCSVALSVFCLCVGTDFESVFCSLCTVFVYVSVPIFNFSFILFYFFFSILLFNFFLFSYFLLFFPFLFISLILIWYTFSMLFFYL